MARKEKKPINNLKKNSSSVINVKKGGKVVKKHVQHNAIKEVDKSLDICPICSKVLFNFNKSKSGICVSCLKNKTTSVKQNKTVAQAKVPKPTTSNTSTELKNTRKSNHKIAPTTTQKPNPSVTSSSLRRKPSPRISKMAVIAAPKRKSLKEDLEDNKKASKRKEQQSVKSNKKEEPDSSKKQSGDKMSLRGKKRSYTQLSSGIKVEDEKQLKKRKNTKTNKETSLRLSRSKTPTIKGSEWLKTISSKKTTSPKPEKAKKGAVEPLLKNSAKLQNNTLSTKRNKNISPKVSTFNNTKNMKDALKRISSKRKATEIVKHIPQRLVKTHSNVVKQTKPKSSPMKAKSQRVASSKMGEKTSKVLKRSKSDIIVKHPPKKQESKKPTKELKSQQSRKHGRLTKSPKITKTSELKNESHNLPNELKENFLIAQEILHDILNSVRKSENIFSHERNFDTPEENNSQDSVLSESVPLKKKEPSLDNLDAVCSDKSMSSPTLVCEEKPSEKKVYDSSTDVVELLDKDLSCDVNNDSVNNKPEGFIESNNYVLEHMITDKQKKEKSECNTETGSPENRSEYNDLKNEVEGMDTGNDECKLNHSFEEVMETSECTDLVNFSSEGDLKANQISDGELHNNSNTIASEKEDLNPLNITTVHADEVDTTKENAVSSESPETKQPNAVENKHYNENKISDPKWLKEKTNLNIISVGEKSDEIDDSLKDDSAKKSNIEKNLKISTHTVGDTSFEFEEDKPDYTKTHQESEKEYKSLENNTADDVKTTNITIQNNSSDKESELADPTNTFSPILENTGDIKNVKEYTVNQSLISKESYVNENTDTDRISPVTTSVNGKLSNCSTHSSTTSLKQPVDTKSSSSNQNCELIEKELKNVDFVEGIEVAKILQGNTHDKSNSLFLTENTSLMNIDKGKSTLPEENILDTNSVCNTNSNEIAISTQEKSIHTDNGSVEAISGSHLNHDHEHPRNRELITEKVAVHEGISEREKAVIITENSLSIETDKSGNMSSVQNINSSTLMKTTTHTETDNNTFSTATDVEENKEFTEDSPSEVELINENMEIVVDITVKGISQENISDGENFEIIEQKFLQSKIEKHDVSSGKNLCRMVNGEHSDKNTAHVASQVISIDEESDLKEISDKSGSLVDEVGSIEESRSTKYVTETTASTPVNENTADRGFEKEIVDGSYNIEDMTVSHEGEGHSLSMDDDDKQCLKTIHNDFEGKENVSSEEGTNAKSNSFKDEVQKNKELTFKDKNQLSEDIKILENENLCIENGESNVQSEKSKKDEEITETIDSQLVRDNENEICNERKTEKELSSETSQISIGKDQNAFSNFEENQDNYDVSSLPDIKSENLYACPKILNSKDDVIITSHDNVGFEKTEFHQAPSFIDDKIPALDNNSKNCSIEAAEFKECTMKPSLEPKESEHNQNPETASEHLNSEREQINNGILEPSESNFPVKSMNSGESLGACESLFEKKVKDSSPESHSQSVLHAENDMTSARKKPSNLSGPSSVDIGGINSPSSRDSTNKDGRNNLSEGDHSPKADSKNNPDTKHSLENPIQKPASSTEFINKYNTSETLLNTSNINISSIQTKNDVLIDQPSCDGIETVTESKDTDSYLMKEIVATTLDSGVVVAKDSSDQIIEKNSEMEKVYSSVVEICVDDEFIDTVKEGDQCPSEMAGKEIFKKHGSEDLKNVGKQTSNEDINLENSKTCDQFSQKMEDNTQDSIDLDDVSMVCNSETLSSNRMSVDEETMAMDLDQEDTAINVNLCQTIQANQMNMEIS